MARLIIISGASGAGKSFLLEIAKELPLKIVPIKKVTTRKNRKNENSDETLDLKLNRGQDEISNCDYTYPYNGNNYGFNKEDINKELNQNKNPIVIVAKCDTIKKIKNDYKNALVIYVQSALNGEDLQKELEKRGDNVSLEERTTRQNESLKDYIRHINDKIFDYVLINNFQEQFKDQIEYIFERELQIDNNFIFVIMSFLEQYDKVYKTFQNAGEQFKQYNKYIKVERAGIQKGGYSITKQIDELIEKAGLIICDVSETSKSSNIYYEFGYAMAKGKTIITTAKSGTKLPFDTRQYKTIFYDDEMQLHDQIFPELKYYFEKK